MIAIKEHRPGSYTVGGEQAGQPQYFPLEVRLLYGALWSAWRPSWYDLWLMVWGFPIRIGILSKMQPPISVIVEEIE